MGCGAVAQALASIAEMTSLTSLSLCDCSALTNNGMLVRCPACARTAVLS